MNKIARRNAFAEAIISIETIIIIVLAIYLIAF